MKRVFAALLIISIVSGVFHFDEFSKLPFLHRHFHENKQKSDGNSFTDYLLSHYIFDKESGESGDHGKLPFKSENCLHQHISVFIHSEIPDVTFHFTTMTFLFPETTSVLSSGDFRIFQPPRLI
jgi:hypothetical protein